MASLKRSRLIVCKRCDADCGDLKYLGVHLLDQHGALAASESPSIDDRTGVETTRHSLLSKDEEIALGLLIQGKGPRAMDARNLLVQCNLRLVVSLAKIRRPDKSKISDLIQEGNIGLMTAADRFDPSKGCRFTTYATWWIRQTMQRGSHKLNQLIAIPEIYHWKLSRAKKLLADGMYQDEVAEKVGIAKPSLDGMLKTTAARKFSLNRPVGEDGSGQTLEGHIAAPEDPAKVLLLEELQSVLVGLGEREKLVLTRRFGLDGAVEKTLDEVGEEVGVTRERVRQIERAALDVLRKRHDRSGTLLAQGAFVERRNRKVDLALIQNETIAPRVEGRDEVEKGSEVEVANTELDCPKCGVKKESPRSLGQHRRYCKGRKSAPPAPRGPKAAAAPAKDNDGSVEEDPDLPLVVPDRDPEPKVRTRVLSELEATKARCEAELKECQILIDAVTKAPEAGA